MKQKKQQKIEKNKEISFIENLYSEDGIVRENVIAKVEAAIDVSDNDFIKKIVHELHQSEVADILVAIHEERRQKFIELAGDEFDFTSLTEIDETIRLQIIEALPNTKIAEKMSDIDSDDAVFILEHVEETELEDILANIPAKDRNKLRKSLEYPEETAGRRMQTEFVAVPPEWNVGQVIDYLRADKDIPQTFSQIFVTDQTSKLLGVINLDTLLRTSRNKKIKTIQEDNPHPVPTKMDQEEAAHVIEQYDLLSAPVIDESQRLVGVLTIDDVVDVLQQETEENMLRLAGVGHEELSGSIRDTAKSRIGWLVINLITAVLASVVIGMFEATLEQMVALAILMPIVASMGGNAGTQTMTVAVRALASKDLDTYNVRKIIRKELVIGFVNGVAFAILIGIIAVIWFAIPSLGLVIALAMIVNMISAAAAGIFIPLTLNKIGLDPAIASGVFVTTVTDVVGFFGFLALAAWWFGL